MNQPAFSSFYSSSYSFSLLHFSPVLIGPSGLNLLTLGHQNLRAHFWWCGSGSSISADLGSTLSTTGLRFNFVPQVILRGMYGEACLGSQNGQLELIFSNSVIFSIYKKTILDHNILLLKSWWKRYSLINICIDPYYQCSRKLQYVLCSILISFRIDFGSILISF